MANALFITIKELKRDTAVGGNVDPDKLLPSLQTAQELVIEPVIGSVLYDKLNDGIVSGSLAEPYITLKNKYIHPILIHAALEYHLLYASYQITDGGISKWNGGTNHESIDIKDVNLLTNKEHSLAENYKLRLVKHLENNPDLYPEYKEGTGEDIIASKNEDMGGFFLGNTRTYDAGDNNDPNW